MDLLVGFLPDVLSGVDALLLILVSCLASALTAAMGIGGGMMLLAVMANILPATVIIPVHGIVQLGSNAGRAFMMRHYVRTSYVSGFAVGCILGGVVGANLVVALPTHWLKLVLGGFILYSCWLPIRLSLDSKTSTVLLGSATTFISMFVGATGPFVIATLRRVLPDKQVLVGTMAVLMTIQHLTKVVGFGLVGFDFVAWGGLVAVLVISGLVGTFVGKRLLERLPSRYFAIGLKLVISALAIKLIIEALASGALL